MTTWIDLAVAIVLLPAIVYALFGLAVRFVDRLAARHARERMVAKGSTLDRLGAVYGMRRKRGERDGDFRNRIARSVTNIHKRDEWHEP